MKSLQKVWYNYEHSHKGYILEVYVEYPKDLNNCVAIYHFYQKEWKLRNTISLYAIFMIKNIYKSSKTNTESWTYIEKSLE